ncbi:hypothetical protein QYE76_018482 [Lolium multiflorum]|uniref:CCHC-type domain-containing protein n=1 Tax=Lolium multiflorum TaxID=4521 RepID=A0AAD8QC35_LOLMU|nr:hypothetical protein QYE76_018482 [Lolium multiflorum]
MCLTARRPWRTSDARDAARGAGSSPPPRRRAAHRSSARRIRGDRGAEARALLSGQQAASSGDEGVSVSDCDGVAPRAAGSGVASLADFFGQELLFLTGAPPEDLPESEKTSPHQIQSTLVAPSAETPFLLSPVDFPALPSGGSGRSHISGSAPTAPFLMVGTVPIWVAAAGAPPPPGGVDRSQLGFLEPSATPLTDLGPAVSVGPSNAGPTGLGPPTVSTGERLDARHVPQGQSLTGQIDALDPGLQLSDSAPAPPVHKWLWMKIGTLDPSFGFPASEQDISRNHRRAKLLRSHTDPISGVLSRELMDRNWRGGNSGKRPYDAISGGAARRRDQDLRQRLDREEEIHRRQQRAWDDNSQRPREEARYARDQQLPPPPPLHQRGRESGKGAGPRRNRPPRNPQGADQLGPQTGLSESVAGESSGGDVTRIICYKCGQSGHMQVDCTANPFCVNCKKEGHLSAMCSIFSKLQEPFWAGFGGDGKGFFCLEVAEEELHKPKANSALVCIEAGDLTAEQVDAEFKDLVEEDWDWQVHKVSETDFSLVFPSKESLRMAIRGGGIKLPTSQCHALVMSNTADPSAVEQLVEVKVKLLGVPPPFRYSDRLLVGARELGRPLTVDEASLAIEDAPVRLTVGCRAPVQLPDSITLFVNMQGFRVRVVREDAPAASGPLSPSPHHKPSADEDEDDAADSDGDRWDGRRGRHASKEPQSSAPMKNLTAKNQGKGVGASRKSVPLTATSPCTDKELPLTSLPKTVFSQYGSNLTKDGDIFPIVAQIVASASLPTSNPEEELTLDSEPLISISVSELCTPGGGATSGQSYVTPFKAKSLSEEEKKELDWQTPISAAEEDESLREKERRSKSNNDRPSKVHNPVLTEVASHLEFSDDSVPASKLVGDQLQGGLVIPELAAPVARAPRSRASPVEATRKSARGQGLTEGPVLERAMRAAADKDPGS